MSINLSIQNKGAIEAYYTVLFPSLSRSQIATLVGQFHYIRVTEPDGVYHD